MGAQYRNLTSYSRRLKQLFAAKNLSRGIVSAVCVFGFAATDTGLASAQFIGPEQSSTPAGAPAPTTPVGSETPGPDTPTVTSNGSSDNQGSSTATPAAGYIAPLSNPAGAYNPDSNPNTANPIQNGTPSEIWSGFVVKHSSQTSGLFNSASADWVVPSVSCLLKNGSKAPNGTQDLIWVGLGGSSTGPLEQAGIGVVCDGGKADYKAFYEAYDTNYNGGGPVALREGGDSAPTVSLTHNCLDIFKGFICSNNYMPVSPRDTIFAEVTAKTKNDYLVTLKDNKWKSGFSINLPATGNPNSAEWMVESPVKTSASPQHPLLNFGSFAFTNCYADDKPIADYQDLTPVELMTDNNGSLGLPVKISLGAVSGAVFTEQWENF